MHIIAHNPEVASTTIFRQPIWYIYFAQWFCPNSYQTWIKTVGIDVFLATIPLCPFHALNRGNKFRKNTHEVFMEKKHIRPKKWARRLTRRREGHVARTDTPASHMGHLGPWASSRPILHADIFKYPENPSSQRHTVFRKLERHHHNLCFGD
jgi:hypothetical protein